MVSRVINRERKNSLVRGRSDSSWRKCASIVFLERRETIPAKEERRTHVVRVEDPTESRRNVSLGCWRAWINSTANYFLRNINRFDLIEKRYLRAAGKTEPTLLSLQISRTFLFLVREEKKKEKNKKALSSISSWLSFYLRDIGLFSLKATKFRLPFFSFISRNMIPHRAFKKSCKTNISKWIYSWNKYTN